MRRMGEGYEDPRRKPPRSTTRTRLPLHHPSGGSPPPASRGEELFGRFRRFLGLPFGLLSCPHVGVEAVLAEELGVGAAFGDAALVEDYTLSLHDALPI